MDYETTYTICLFLLSSLFLLGFGLFVSMFITPIFKGKQIIKCTKQGTDW